MNSKYLHIFSKVLAKRKITKCLMGHMAHITIFGFFFLFFLFYRSLNSGRGAQLEKNERVDYITSYQ